MGCYVAAGVTGAHLNPAVTLALAVHRRFPWDKVAPYVAAQFVGAFVASAVVYVTYHEALTAFDGGMRQVTGPQGTAGIWATYPQPFLSTFPGGFIDQVVGTALLVGVIFGITDTRNSPPPAGLTPVIVGLLVRADRRDVRLQLRLRHQSGARSRTASVHGGRRLGRRRVSRRQQLVVGAGDRAVRRRGRRRLGLRRARRRSAHRWTLTNWHEIAKMQSRQAIEDALRLCDLGQFALRNCPMQQSSVRHRVEHDVDADRVAARREQVEVLARLSPSRSQVSAMSVLWVITHHQPLLGVLDALEVDLRAVGPRSDVWPPVPAQKLIAGTCGISLTS